MALAGPSRLSPLSPGHSFLSHGGSATHHLHDNVNTARSLDDSVSKGKGKQPEREAEGTEQQIVDSSNGRSAYDILQEKAAEEDLGFRWLFDEADDETDTMPDQPEEEPDTSKDAMARITDTLERRAEAIEQRPVEVEPTRWALSRLY
jgi:hypothetical protein